MIKRKRLVLIMGIASLLLALPLIAMQFSDEVDWSGGDFLMAGGMLYGSGLLIEMILRKLRATTWRIVLSFGVVLVLLILWIEMAVGVFGSPIAGS